jgi:signal transduction histidine kinase
MNEVIDILLVDDEPRNLEALEAILSEPGYRLLRAQDADGALKLLLEHDVAAIVLDIKMPGMSGFELAEMIKATKRYREIPILFLTAYLLEDQDVLTGYGAGAVDYLTKPLNPKIVRHKVAVFADLFRKTRALAALNEKLEERVQERTAELEKSEAALREADRNKDQFIAILAHELRNPLAPLLFGLDILAGQQEPVAPVVKKTIDTMGRQLRHMVRLVDDLLDISRVSSGAIELKRQRVELAAVIEGAIEIVRPIIDMRRLRLVVEAARDVFTDGDSTRLVQIVGNLLHNAAKFTPEEGHIDVRLERDDDHALIRVIDSGGGIVADQIERAFEMFARFDRVGANVQHGLGIGLALGRRLAEMHGGTLTAESEGIGHGTTFTLRLPMVESAPQLAVQVETRDSVTTNGSLDIVVIEDSEDVADMLAALLQLMGHRVSVAYSCLSGISLVEQNGPRVVLCDIGLPDLDGVEVCRRVRGLGLAAQPLMVALTGWGRDHDRHRTREAGFDEHLVKPVDMEKLKLVLNGYAGVH